MFTRLQKHQDITRYAHMLRSSTTTISQPIQYYSNIYVEHVLDENYVEQNVQK